MGINIPQKHFFRSAEVADLLQVKSQEVNFWTTEFSQVKPQKTKSGQRIYSREDVLLLHAVKHLLYDKKFTLAGARHVIEEAELVRQSLQPPTLSASLLETEALDVGEDFLLEAAHALNEESSFEKQTKEIYQACGSELLPPVEQPIIAQEEAQTESREQTHLIKRLSDSKSSLHDVMKDLESQALAGLKTRFIDF